ncbi:MAG: hypothetical protein GC156_08560 [Actinomycetales bacterium]|nr:hypothetical protein [Actinomycetales bacterium]
MTETQWNAIERQARIFVRPSLSGPDAEAAVRAILAWEWTNPDVSPERRSGAWSGIVNRASVIY